MPKKSSEFIRVHDPGQVGKYLSDEPLRRLARRVIALETKVKNIQINFVEFLGIFTAILAFIVVFVQISLSKLVLGEMVILMMSFSIVLIIFVLVIDHIIKRR